MMGDLSQDCYIAGCSETTNPTVFQFASTQIKDRLLEAGECSRIHDQVFNHNVATLFLLCYYMLL